MKILVFVLSLISLFAQEEVEDQGPEVIIAIDCGNLNAYQSPEGVNYIADDYFFGSSRIADYTYSEIVQNNKIRFALDPTPYFTERHGENFGYEIPLKGDGDYTLILKFVELYFQKPDERVFNILFGDQMIRENFSIVKEVGESISSHEEFIEFTVKDNKVFWNNQECQNAFKPKSQRVALKFQQGLADLPKVDGIILLRGHVADDLLKSRQYLMKNWEKILQEQEKYQKKMLEQQQQQQQGDDEQSQTQQQPWIEDSEESTESTSNNQEGIIAFLFSPIGLIIMSSVGLVLFVMIKVDNKSSKQTKKQK